jgi:type I site-specific restriction-modification system R (restriction) subunit
MPTAFTESVVEHAALAWLEGLGYTVLHGPEIAVGTSAAERTDPTYRDVILEGRLRQALARLNPGLPAAAAEDAFRKLTRTAAPSLLARNRAVHRMLVDGVTVEYTRKDGSIAGAQARVIDFDNPENNDWLAVNQFTVAEGQHTRRLDVVLFVNGLPLAVIELKNPADEDATVWSAFQQLHTYQAQVPALFAFNAALVASDGVQARIGTLGAGKGALKVVMTGSPMDPLDWQPHIRNKAGREALAQRFRDPGDPFRVAIVRDMWLTGFDAPSLHTMYVDKPMRGHGLMQAIARVNRVFRDKPGGLVVDYLGLADELKKALATYTQSGGTGKTAIDQAEAVAVMQERLEVCRGLFHGFVWARWLTGTSADRVSVLPLAQEHILAQEDGKNRLLRAVTELSQAFALAVPHEAAMAIRDEVGFYQAVRAVLAKGVAGTRKTDEELDLAIRQIVSKAVISDEVVDIFAAAGLKKPDISILSDEFLAEVHGMPQRNLAVELLQKLIKGEIRTRLRRNVVQARSFAELLELAIRKYQNRAIETAQVIEELIALARDMREAGARGEALGLNEDELAFYDALETNDSAVKVLGDETLRDIARELVKTVRANVTIDWTLRENVRAQLRVLVKRVLRKFGYPPDKQEKATLTVLEQAEVLSEGWAAA